MSRDNGAISVRSSTSGASFFNRYFVNVCLLIHNDLDWKKIARSNKMLNVLLGNLDDPFGFLFARIDSELSVTVFLRGQVSFLIGCDDIK